MTTAGKTTAEKVADTETPIIDTEKPTVHEEVKTSKDPLEVRVARLTKAHESVKNYTMSAVSIGFVPIPLVDLAVLTAIQLKMLDSLAKNYDVPFSKNLTKSLLISLASSSIAVNIAMPLGSLFKAVPIIGQTSGLISTALTGAAFTYAVGKLFIEHFESDGTFLDFDVKKYRAHFKDLYEEGKSFVSPPRQAAEAKS